MNGTLIQKKKNKLKKWKKWTEPMRKKIEEHQYEEGLQECKRWLENKYDGLTEYKKWNDFGLKDIHFSKSGFGSCFYQNPNHQTSCLIYVLQ